MAELHCAAHWPNCHECGKLCTCPTAGVHLHVDDFPPPKNDSRKRDRDKLVCVSCHRVLDRLKCPRCETNSFIQAPELSLPGQKVCFACEKEGPSP